MVSLFPKDTNFEDIEFQDNTKVEFKGSYKFDFEVGEFVKNPDGTIARCGPEEAYVQWCKKAMLTNRYLLAYSDKFGNEIDTLRGSKLSKKAIELEVKRMTKEALLVHPKTNDVDNFTFKWTKGNLLYEYEVKSDYANKMTLQNELKVW